MKPWEDGLLTRRAVLKNGSLVLVGALGARASAFRSDAKPLVSIGYITDIHHADKEPQGTRFYRAARSKANSSLELIRLGGAQHIVHLGDLVDAMPKQEEEEQLIRSMASAFRATSLPYSMVTGNHCLARVSKRRFADLTDTVPGCHSVDLHGVTLVHLDACFRADGVAYDSNNYDWKDTAIPDQQVDWLAGTLKRAQGPCIVGIHQLLDDVPNYAAKGRERARDVIAKSGKVVAVLQGHYHQNRLTEFDNVPYVVLRSVIDGGKHNENGGAVVSIFADGSAKIDGLFQQASRDLKSRLATS